MRTTIVVLVALAGIIPAGAQQYGGSLLEPDSSGRPMRALFASGEVAFTMELVGSEGQVPFAMKMEDGAPLGVSLIVAIGTDASAAIGTIMDGELISASVDGSRACSVNGRSFRMELAGLTRGEQVHELAVTTSQGSMTIRFRLVGEPVDLRTIPGAIGPIPRAPEAPRSPTIPPTTLSPVPMSERTRYLLESTARGLRYAGRINERGEFSETGSRTFLFVALIEPSGEIWRGGDVYVEGAARWSTWGARASDGCFLIPSRSVDPLDGVDPGDTIKVGIKGGVLVTVTIPTNGNGLWLPLVVQD